MLKIESINVGLPRNVNWKGEIVSTGIFKDPVKGPQKVNFLNIEGDRQADLSVHGGPDKAVYAYAAEHYPYWQEAVPKIEFTWGIFGENLTVSGGLLEDQIMIGDEFKIGSILLVATQPRLPCYKLGIRLGDARYIKSFMQAERPGVYFRILQEGSIDTGDEWEKVKASKNDVSILDIMRIYSSERNNYPLMERAY